MYFYKSLGAWGLHRSLIADTIRTERFRKAIHKVVKPGDIVLDIGCGTGILSFFACQAGAGHVYAIEEGPIMQVAKSLAHANGFEDKITFLSGNSSRLTLPKLADVLLSETLGNFGVDEAIISIVEDAKKRLLKPHARIMPSSLEMIVAAVNSPKLYDLVSFWEKSAYGFSFKEAREKAVHQAYSVNPLPEELISEPATLGEFFLGSEFKTPSDTPEYIGSAEVRIREDGIFHGVCGWFSSVLAGKITVGNAPGAGNDHDNWMQTFFPTTRPMPVKKGEVVKIEFQIPKDAIAWTNRFTLTSANGEVTVQDQSNYNGMDFEGRKD